MWQNCQRLAPNISHLEANFEECWVGIMALLGMLQLHGHHHKSQSCYCRYLKEMERFSIYQRNFESSAMTKLSLSCTKMCACLKANLKVS